MRALIQRVAWAEVEVDGGIVGRIKQGLLVYVGVGPDDQAAQARWLAGKIADMRIFEDDQGKMNLAVQDIRGGILAVSNFTLLADARKGRRPSFVAAARPEPAQELFDIFVREVAQRGVPVSTGLFGAHMDIRSQADGPVNIVLDAALPTEGQATAS
ncbi:MAG: D-aminoacyl-tRNA deacylase [Phycisphaerae bacterium]|jgi:D-tyrosyl-tRNA(Tyr) deacylase